MVMATPSPQQVGREFVRQYYTFLHEAPQVLHRFYSNGSTFVHGGVDRPGMPAEEPVIGQLEIDKKINVLNFKDCHTKIRQVDSQATIGNGIVVQVTGELSNNGEPMRRFMQTFVLAPQTPKKFYVHNDIFRYQDEVYHDNSDTESEDHSVAETRLGLAETNNSSAKLNNNNYNNYSSESNDVVELKQKQQQQPSPSQTPTPNNENDNDSHNNSHHHAEQMMNGHSTEMTVEAVRVNEPVVLENNPLSDVIIIDKLANIDKENKPVENTPALSAVVDNGDIKSQAKNPEQAPKINSWAKMISNNGVADVNNSSAFGQYTSNGVANTAQQGNNKHTTTTTKDTKFNNTKQPVTNGTHQAPAGVNKLQNKSRSSLSTSSNNNNNSSQQQQQSSQPQQQQSQQQRNEQRVSESVDARYPDIQQVFIGNLSPDLSEPELRAYFGQFGKVVEVRINSNTKQQSGRRLPNYGFVVFEEKAHVDCLLGSTKSNNLTYKNDQGIEYRLNVEEKRMRQGRMNSGFDRNSKNRVARSSSNGSRGGGQPNKAAANKQHNNEMNGNGNNYNGNSNGFESKQRTHNNGDHQMLEAGGGHRKANTRRS